MMTLNCLMLLTWIIVQVCTADRCIYTQCSCCAGGFCNTTDADEKICDGCVDGFTGPLCEEPCPPGCATCSQTNNPENITCTICKNGYYNGKPFDNDKHPEQNNCALNCKPSCESCTSYHNCSKCMEGFRMTDDGGCAQCPKHCAKCLSSTNCEKCMDSYYWNGDYCIACTTHCNTCTSPNNCEKCSEGFFLYDNICQPCKSECLSCNSSDTCSLCSKGFYLNNEECLPCKDNCVECSGPAYECEECRDRYYPNRDSCSPCKEGCLLCRSESSCLLCKPHYRLVNGICMLCPDGCTSCSADNICTKCEAGHYLESSHCKKCPVACLNGTCTSTGTCVINCPDVNGKKCSCPAECICLSSKNCIVAQRTEEEGSNPLPVVLGICIPLFLMFLGAMVGLCIYKRRQRRNQLTKKKPSDDKEDRTSLVKNRDGAVANVEDEQARTLVKDSNKKDHVDGTRRRLGKYLSFRRLQHKKTFKELGTCGEEELQAEYDRINKTLDAEEKKKRKKSHNDEKKDLDPINGEEFNGYSFKVPETRWTYIAYFGPRTAYDKGKATWKLIIEKNCSIILVLNHQKREKQDESNHQNQEKKNLQNQLLPMFDDLCQATEFDNVRIEPDDQKFELEDEQEFELENSSVQFMQIVQESGAERKVALIKIVMSDTSGLPDESDILSLTQHGKFDFREETSEKTVLVYCSCRKAAVCVGLVIAFDALLQEGTRSGNVNVPACVKHLCRLSGRKMFKQVEHYVWLNRALANAKSQESMETEEETRDAEGKEG